MLKKTVGLFFLVAFFAGSAHAQTATGTITGRITDPSGAVRVGVKVTATNADNSLNRSVLTNDSGNYSIPDLPVGAYRVEAESDGFKKVVFRRIRVEAAQTNRANLSLDIGAITETVEVMADEPLLQADDTAISHVIDQETILRLPIPGRRFDLFALLYSGVNPPVGFSHLYSRGGLNTAGLDEHYTGFYLDGTDNGDPVIRSFSFIPSIEVIRSFKLVEAGANAEFGRNAGAGVIVTTRSGSNRLSYSLWEYLRNHQFDARNYFAPSIFAQPPLIRNQFGGTAGGPIIPDRMFFFFTYEGLRLKQGVSRLATVPTEQMRTGDLSELGASSVPPGEIHPLALETIQSFPLPNLPGIRGNRAETANRIEDGNDFSLKVDHHLLSHTWIFGRVSSSVTRVVDPFRTETGGVVNLSSFGQTADRIRVSGGFSVITEGRNYVNEFRAGYNRVRQPVIPMNPGTLLQEPLMGFEKAFLNFSIFGFDTLGSGAEFKRAVNVYNYIDAVSFNSGNHQLKAGVDLRRYLFNSYVVSPNSFTFDGSRTGNALADFLRGMPSLDISSTGSPGGNAKKTEVAGYLQDVWKASSRLTMNYGLRWEFYGRITEKLNKQSLWVAECNCMLTAGKGLPPSLVGDDYNNFAPRVGLAFRPFKRSVVRASAGIYYDNDMRHNSEVIMNPPFFQTNFFAASMAPSLSFDNPFPANAGFASLSPVTLDLRYRDTYASVWTLGFQHEPRRNVLIDVTYVGNHLVKARRLRNLNQFANGIPPYAGFSRIFAFEQAGSSSYHSLQMRVERRFTGGLGFISSYTWSHAIDDRPGQGGALAQDNLNLRAERGDADFDVRHRWTLSSMWDLPVGPGRRWGSHWSGALRALSSGWGISAVSAVQSGRPFSVTLRSDNSRSGNLADRPNPVPGVNWRPVDQRPDLWIDPAAFSAAPQGTFGALGRNTLRGPGLFNLDVSLAKNHPMGDNVRLQFRADVFNVFNRPNFSIPAAQLDSPTTFGVISSTILPERQIQFGLRLEH